MSQSPKNRRPEQGYILLMLMLAVTILAIAAAAVIPSITQQVKRDREEELIHRGVQYSRAIRHYFKQFSRYPSRIEELESTNRLRFLRKRYKDPITGQDFKLLHFGEVQMFQGGGLLGATPAGAAGAPGGAAQLFNAAAAQGIAGAMAQAQGLAAQSGMNAGTPASTTDASGQDPNSPNSGSSANNNPLSAQVFGGGPIVGVASKSKDKSIREFNKKNHYNDWQFIYDPNTDRGGLLNTPAQPPLQGAAQNLSNQLGQPGQTGTGFGGNQNSSFGQSPQNQQQNSNQGPGLIQPQPPDQ